MENIQLEAIPQPSTSHGHNFLYVLKFTHKEKRFQLDITPENFSSKIIEPENIREIFQQAFQNGEKFEECLDVHGTIELNETCHIYLCLTQRVTAKKIVSEELYFFPEIVSHEPFITQQISNQQDFLLLSYTEITNQQFKLVFTYKNCPFESIIDPSTFHSEYICLEMLGFVLQEKTLPTHNIDLLFDNIDSQTIAFNISLTPKGVHTPHPSETILILCTAKNISFDIDLQGSSYHDFLKFAAAEPMEIAIARRFNKELSSKAKYILLKYLQIHFDACLLKPYVFGDNRIQLLGENGVSFVKSLNDELLQSIQLITDLANDLANGLQHRENLEFLVKEQMQQIYKDQEVKIKKMDILYDFCFEIANSTTISAFDHPQPDSRLIDKIVHPPSNSPLNTRTFPTSNQPATETIIVKPKKTETSNATKAFFEMTPRERILAATEKRLESAPKRRKVESKSMWPSEKADPLRWD